MLITTQPSKSGKTMYTVLEIQNHSIKLQSKKKAMLVKNLLSERQVTIESVKVNKLCKLVINTIDCGRITKQDYNTLLTLTTNGDTTNDDSNDYQTTSPSNIEILGQTDSGSQPEWTQDDLLCGQQRVQISSESDGRDFTLETLLDETQPTGENSGLSTQRELSVEERFEQYDIYLKNKRARGEELERSECPTTSQLGQIIVGQSDIARGQCEIALGQRRIRADQREIAYGVGSVFRAITVGREIGKLESTPETDKLYADLTESMRLLNLSVPGII
jgi:hypothetical protein